MKLERRVLPLLVALAAAPWAVACADDGVEPEANRAPEAVDSIPAVETAAGEVYAVDVSDAFSDPDGDSLSYEAVTSDAAVAAVSVSGGVVTVEGVAEGAATVTVTASDPDGLSAQQSFRVTVGPRSERAVLVAFYEATGGDEWTNRENWLTEAPLGEWFGVLTGSDPEGRVSWVRLKENNLSGPIPPELGQLSRLGTLDLRENNLSGPIPPELGQLSRLGTLDLGWNDLSGPIPPELGDLSNLISLNLALNSLSGPIPPELGQLAELRTLRLGWNDLSGPIPPELGDLSNLGDLRLGSNHLGGSIPPELGQLSNLTDLHLTNSRLSGPIPPELSDLSNLEWLSLAANGLTGPIPPELGDLSNLTHLGLGLNSLSGPIPPELAGLSNLWHLELWRNRLTGPIPSELGKLSNLGLLALEGNRLTGPIPPELGDLPRLHGLLLEDNLLTGPIPSELGDLSRLGSLIIGGNLLTGPIPPELGQLSELKYVLLEGNGLTGPIPGSFSRLIQLEAFSFAENDGLCAPGTPAIGEWSQAIARFEGPFCNASDRAVLGALHDAAGGEGWSNSEGWGGGVAPSEWYGVRTDSLGRVTGLDLSGNGLEGRLPPSLGLLASLTELKVGGNALAGRVPLSMAVLPLLEFGYADTDLCTPPAESFRAWLQDLPVHEGTGVECAPLLDRDILVSVYDATGGPKWRNDDEWLSDAPLGEWSGVEVDDEGRVTGVSLAWNKLSGLVPAELGELSNLRELDLAGNGLTGPVPTALGELSNLEHLSFSGNALSGPIPSELGELSNLRVLDLAGNRLAGPVPTALGELSNLDYLSLDGNALSGPIPVELAELSDLSWLILSGNGLSGPIPVELGALSGLRHLSLSGNALSGPVPSGFGGLSRLERLDLANNPGMSGALPTTLTALRQLEEFAVHGTELCAPFHAGFLEWLKEVAGERVPMCVPSRSMAYLTQAVQSAKFPVPLVAGEPALLRVFVTAQDPGGAGIPPVRARFHVDGAETHVVDIPGQSATIPREVDEGDLSKSANALIPGRFLRPGLEMVIEVDPDGTLDPGVGVVRRIPETGRAEVTVREMPTLDLTLIPFIWSEYPDTSIVGTVRGMAADPGNHELLWETHTLLPVGALEVTAHDAVTTSSNSAYDVHRETKAIRVMEGGTGHYMGTMAGSFQDRSGIAAFRGRTSFSVPRARIIARQLGHNLSLVGAPCGTYWWRHPSRPEWDGTIGAWGYDFREGGRLVPPTTADLMSNCAPPWISEYHFTAALRFRLSDDDLAGMSSAPPAPGRTILLWGGADPEGVPFLEPAFVTGAPPALPASGGAYELTGRTASGGELFSLSFDMPEVAGGEGGSSFAFALPVRAEWAGRLASVTLSGPGGSFTLDQRGERAAAIFLDPRTGRVRGILRGLAPSIMAPGAAGALAPEGGLTVLVSRGIPGPGEWRR